MRVKKYIWSIIVIIVLVSIPNVTLAENSNPVSLRFLSWNILHDQAFENDDLNEQVRESLENTDIILLQESGPIASSYIARNFSEGQEFESYGREYGLYSYSNIPMNLRNFIDLKDEPIRPKVDKGIQIFWLDFDQGSLMVINTHLPLLNENEWKKAMGHIERVLESHRGPLILSGDFNRSLSKNRFKRWNLEKVPFERYKGHKKVMWTEIFKTDHLYIRGVRLDHIERIPTNSSDHVLNDFQVTIEPNN